MNVFTYCIIFASILLAPVLISAGVLLVAHIYELFNVESKDDKKGNKQNGK